MCACAIELMCRECKTVRLCFTVLYGSKVDLHMMQIIRSPLRADWFVDIKKQKGVFKGVRHISKRLQVQLKSSMAITCRIGAQVEFKA